MMMIIIITQSVLFGVVSSQRMSLEPARLLYTTINYSMHVNMSAVARITFLAR